jgi:hypothetical protein
VNLFRLLATLIAALATAFPAGAQLAGTLIPRSPPPPAQSIIHGTFGGGFHRHHGFGGGGFILYPETEVVHDVVVVHDQPAEPPAPPPPPPAPKEPWVMGRTYASLPPQGCMKMVEKAASYFYCGGDWYRQVGSRSYVAIKKPI